MSTKKNSIFSKNANQPGARLSRQSSLASLERSEPPSKGGSRVHSRRGSKSDISAITGTPGEEDELMMGDDEFSLVPVQSSPSKTRKLKVRRFVVCSSKRITPRIRRAIVHFFIARVFEEELKVRVALEESTSRDTNEQIHAEADGNIIFPGFEGMNITYLKWRQAYNLYMAEQYHEALDIIKHFGLEEGRLLAKCEQGKSKHFMEHTSFVSLTAARCCYRLFLVTKSHYYLEHAYEHYESVISHFRIDMAMYLLLPPVLIEFARLLEHYGAFPAATEMYNNLMRVFPTNKEYFTIMYRCCIVGVYVAEIATDDVYRVDLLNQCIDMLQFLLEALPESINDIHIVILYGKALEMSKDINVKFRAPGVFQSLYDICRAQDMIGAKNFNNYKVWLASPATWLELANLLVSADEPLLARYCFEFHVQKVKSTLSIGTGLPAAIGIETCLRIAKNYASFQNFEDATKYAELALQVDHFHKETRRCISLWSAIHQAMIVREEKSIAILSHNWKERTWTNKYRAKVKKRVVEDLAEEYKEDHFNTEVREKLAYFSTDRWRSKFLYENDSAAKIQHWIREKRKMWKWQDVQRSKYLSLASQAYSLFRKMPFDYKVRSEIIRITNHKMCPRKHAINKVRGTIDHQDIAIDCMRRSWKCAILRWEINRRTTHAEDRRKAYLGKKATLIQCIVRSHLAKVNFSSRYAHLMKKHAAARVVQKYVRWRNTTFQHAVTRVVARTKRAKALAHNKLLMFFVPMIHLVLFRFRRRRAKQIAEAKRKAEIERRKQEARTLNGMVMMIQRFFRYRREVYHSHMFLRRDKLLQKRFWPEYSFSSATWELLAELQNDPDAPYISPGIRQNAPAFYVALQRVNIYCDSTFENIDCMMLAGVLRHKQCRAQRLVLHGFDARHSNFDFDLVAAIGKCKSLRSVYLLGLTVTDHFVKSLFKTVQEVNPRCVEIHIESVEYTPNARLRQHLSMSGSFRKGEVSGRRFSQSATGTRGSPLGNSGSRSRSGSPSMALVTIANTDTDDSPSSLTHPPSPGEKFTRSPFHTDRRTNADTDTDADGDADGMDKLKIKTFSPSRSRSSTPTWHVSPGKGKGKTSPSRSFSRSFSFHEKGSAQAARTCRTPSEALCVPSRRTVYSPALCISAGLLLSDYFNYAVPGITCVTLHKCALRDDDLQLLVQGLQINTSLRKLVLSCNLFEDPGFCSVFRAVLCNTQKTALQVLDFSGNLIRCNAEMRNLLDDFHHICSKGGYLEPDSAAVAVGHLTATTTNTTTTLTNKASVTVAKTQSRPLASTVTSSAQMSLAFPIAFAKQPLEVFLTNNMIIKPYELPLHYTTRSMLILHGVPIHQSDKYVAELVKKQSVRPKKNLGSLLKGNKTLMNSLHQKDAGGTKSLQQQQSLSFGVRSAGLQGLGLGPGVHIGGMSMSDLNVGKRDGEKTCRLLSQTAPMYMGKPLLSSTLPLISSDDDSHKNGDTVSNPPIASRRLLPGLSDFDLLPRSQSVTVLQGQNGKDGGVI